MNDLNKPSFFRKGGLITLDGDQRTTVGKNDNGSFYIDINGKVHARANLSPQQTFDIANGLLKALGYRLELGSGPTQ
jgi:hypothetical protein